MLVRTVLISLCIFGLGLSEPAGAHDDGGHRGHRDNNRSKFEPLSTNHILYGVSQFSHGAVSDAPVPIKLSNANLVTQAATALIYARGKSGEEPPTLLGAYAGCVVKVLPPRSALGISQSEVPLVPPEFSNNGERRYAELIWAPVTPVKVRGRRKSTRLADGLGGTANEANFAAGLFSLTHPSRFTLPSNDVVPGQKEAATDCICQGLAENNAPSDTFSEFGVKDCTATSR